MYKYRNVIRLICYVIFLAGTLVYPVKKILSFECPPVSPSVYQFRVAARDPYDPLRGRSVALTVFPVRIETADQVPQWGRGTGKARRLPLAVLKTAEDGSAGVVAFAENPEQVPAGHDFIRLAGIRHSTSWLKGSPVAPYFYYLQFPFERVFINEKKAADAEKQLRPTPDHPAPGLLVVRVFPDGNFLVDDLLVNGKSVL